jgi:hypothetical protein
MHKWWARRLGVVFRMLLLAEAPGEELTRYKRWDRFYSSYRLPENFAVLDPFLGGGTSLIEAAKLGANCFGYDIDPVACFVSELELSSISPELVQRRYRQIKAAVASKIKTLYRSRVGGKTVNVIYYFWVDRVTCPHCQQESDAHPTFQIAYNEKSKTQTVMVGRRSERFLEANRVYTAAKNQQHDQKKLARLQAVLFYYIHEESMTNYEIREVYDAGGGDPKRKGRRPTRNADALDELLDSFPEPRIIKEVLTGKRSELPSTSPAPTDGKRPKAPTSLPAKPAAAPKGVPDPKAVKAKAELAKEKFLATVQAAKQPKPRQLAERARVPLKALAQSLASKEVRNQLEEDLDEREAVVEIVEAIGQLQAECAGLLKRSRTPGRKDDKNRSKAKSK